MTMAAMCGKNSEGVRRLSGKRLFIYCAGGLGRDVLRLSRRINREYGDSFSALLNGMRIERACQYLHLSIPVQDVAERVGYKSSSQFCRQFRSVMQMTPTEWRTKNVDVR